MMHMRAKVMCVCVCVVTAYARRRGTPGGSTVAAAAQAPPQFLPTPTPKGTYARPGDQKATWPPRGMRVCSCRHRSASKSTHKQKAKNSAESAESAEGSGSGGENGECDECGAGAGPLARGVRVESGASRSGECDCWQQGAHHSTAAPGAGATMHRGGANVPPITKRWAQRRLVASRGWARGHGLAVAPRAAGTPAEGPEHLGLGTLLGPSIGYREDVEER
jgi:hypothetical protein